MDETAHTGFRDRSSLDVDSDAVRGCREPSFGWCDRYAIETEFWEFWEAVLEVTALVGHVRGRAIRGLRWVATVGSPRPPGEAPLVADGSYVKQTVVGTSLGLRRRL
jgi:hypothetical protein